MIGTCGATGNRGPSEVACKKHVKTLGQQMSHRPSTAVFEGLQTWKVPHDGYYT